MNTDEQAYKFPINVKELDEAAHCFGLLSSQGEIKVFVACLDVFLLQIQVPSGQGIFFRALSDTYGIDVQAACD